MVDQGAPPAAGSTRPVRVYEYEAMIGTRFGERGSGQPCNFRQPSVRSADKERQALPVASDEKGRCRLHGGASG